MQKLIHVRKWVCPFLFALLNMLISCSEEIRSKESMCRLNSISYPNSVVVSYHYQGQNLVKSESTGGTWETYTYDSKNHLIKRIVNLGISTEYNYTYEDNRIKFFTTQFYLSTDPMLWTCEYNSSSQLIKIVNGGGSYFTFEYESQTTTNVKEIKVFKAASISPIEVWVFECDTNKSPFKFNFLNVGYPFQFQNNIVKITITGAFPSQSINSYTYNDHGFPDTQVSQTGSLVSSLGYSYNNCK